MKILQINASYKPAYVYGGPTMSVSKLSEQLVTAGHTVHVITTTANGDAELDVPAGEMLDIDGVPVTYYPRIIKGHIHFSPKLLAAVWRDCRKYDIVHIHAWWNTVSVLSCLIAVSRGCKVVISPRGTLSAYSFGHRNSLIKSIIHGLLTKPLIRRSYIHATSCHEELALANIIKPKGFYNISNFVAFPDEISESQPAQNAQLELLFLSRIDNKKGLDILLDALALVHRPYQLYIAGDGDLTYINYLKEKIQKIDIERNIYWLGFQNEQKFELLAKHHLMVLTSRDENFGNVVIESLSMGTPVLISEHVGLATYVSDNNLGKVIPLDATAIANAIDNISFEELIAIRRQAPAIIRRDFHPDTLTERYTNMYQQIPNNG